MAESDPAPDQRGDKTQDRVVPRFEERDYVCSGDAAGWERVAKTLHDRFLEGIVAFAPWGKHLFPEGDDAMAIGAKVIGKRRKPMQAEAVASCSGW